MRLAGQGTRVTALHVAYMDTDMTRHLDVPKSDPAAIAKLAIDGIAGDAEIIADGRAGASWPGSPPESPAHPPRPPSVAFMV